MTNMEEKQATQNFENFQHPWTEGEENKEGGFDEMDMFGSIPDYEKLP